MSDDHTDRLSKVGGPLDDIRIVAVEQYGAGPFATMHLADLGAEVIKIEDPNTGGDVGRYVPPMQVGEDSLFFETYNRNKRSLSLDIRNPRGREVFERLVASSDVVFSNLRGDVPERLGITYADLKGVNPSIVCCSLSGFGMSGPRRTDPAYDYIIQGLAGWMDLTGEPDGPPTKSGLSMVDFAGGYVAAITMLAGVHAARRSGVGFDCDLSLYDTAISLLGYVATWHLNSDFVPQRMPASAHPSLVPFQNFRTADGWIVIGCAKEKFWQRLVEVLGLDELAEDPRFVDFDARRANRDLVVSAVEERLVERRAEEWISALRGVGVPCAPVSSVAQALRDPQTAARALLASIEHEEFGSVQLPISPVRVGTDPVNYRPAPRRGADRDYVLTALLGTSADELAALDAAGAFGPVEQQAEA